MKEQSNSEKTWGYALIGFGALMLAANMGWLGAFGAGGPIFLALLSAVFLAVFVNDRKRWWAVIPGGILATLALVDWVELTVPRLETGWLFFLGVAATFGFLYLRPDGGARKRWAVWPAGVAVGIALLDLLETASGSVIAPLALIGLGVFLFTRDSRKDRSITQQEGERQ